MLPRSLLFSPSPADALLESAGIAILGGLVCFLFKIRHEMDMQRRQSATDLETMQQELQSHIRLSRSNEKRLATLHAISALLSRSLDMRQVLRAGLDMLMEVMEVEAALIFSLDERTQELKLIAYEGMSEKFAQSVNHSSLCPSGQEDLLWAPFVWLTAARASSSLRKWSCLPLLEARLVLR